ncbi:MAG: putative ATP-dependent protease [Paracoccaceae bacterium]|jgi:predicted ATP-dependent protease
MPKTPDDFPQSLDPAILRRETDPVALGFSTTADIADIAGLIGQDRAVDAIRLAASIPHRDFNLFVLGPVGTGRHRAVDALLETEAAKRPVPCDWVYVNNFDAPHKPQALQLPSGSAVRLKLAMEELVDDLTIEISAVFESDTYLTQRRVIEEEFSERHEEAFADFYESAKEQNVAVLRTPMGFTLAATKNGEIIKPEAYEQLEETEKHRIELSVGALQDQLSDILRAMPAVEKEHRSRVGQLHADMAEQVVSTRIAVVGGKFQAIEPIDRYLTAVRDDMIANAELFLQARHAGADSPFPEGIVKYHREPMFQRYAINIMVSHKKKPSNGAPLEKEVLPSLGNLTGRIEHMSEMGALQTNFTLIKPGALHRANGGYLVLDARRLLSEPFAWEALKRCLDNRAISITSAAEILSLVSTTSLEPDPIPLDVRIILIGDRMLHALLSAFDPDFARLFKVQADFEDTVPRSPRTLKLLARLIATSARADGLRPLTAKAVARLLDEAVRMAEDTTHYSLKLSALSDIMREADFYTGVANRSEISRADINHAVTEADRRASRIRDRSHEMITRKTILIDTSGSVAGQVNGLSVINPGRRFGQPSRITARVRVGAGKVVDIEREVELGGPLHSKDVLILSSYLATHYAQDVPLSLQAKQRFSGCPTDRGFAQYSIL